MSQKESKRSRVIMSTLRAQGWFCFKVHGNEYTMAGLPDIIVCAKGVFVALETKEPDKANNTSVRQDLVHGQITAAGGVVSVATTPAQAVLVVERALAAAGKSSGAAGV